MTFTIPGRLPGTNEITRKERAHWSKGYQFRKRYVRLVGDCIVAGRVPLYTEPVNITIHYIEKDNRRDSDNIFGSTKFILDALKSTGRINDDSRKWIADFKLMMGAPDKKNPRIEVTIEPCHHTSNQTPA